MFAFKSASSGHSTGNLNPFGAPSTFGSPFAMRNTSGTTTGVFGTTYSPFPTQGSQSALGFGGFVSGSVFSSGSALGFSSSASGQSTGNPNPFGAPSTFGSPFAMPNASGTTNSVFGTTYSPFSTQGTQSALGFGCSGSGSGFSTGPALGFSSSGFGGCYRPSAVEKTSAFGAFDTTGVGFSSTPTVGPWTTVFGRSDVQSSLGTQSSFSGSHVSTPPFGSQTKGSRVAIYARTSAKDPMNQVSVNLESITAMPIYQDKSHEELRWEDYQSGDKVGFVSGNFNPNPNAFNSLSASLTPISFTPPSTTSAFSPFSSSFYTNSITSSSSTQPSNLHVNHFPSQTPPSSSGSSFANFLSTSMHTPTTFAFTGFSSLSFTDSITTPSFPPTVVTVSAPSSYVSSPSFAPSISASGFNPGFNFTYNQPTSLLPSSAPSPHGSIRGVTVTEAGGQANAAQESGSQTTAAGQQLSGVNPFGSLPPIPKMSIAGPRSSPILRYGISSLPVQEKPAPVRMSSLVTVRHISRRNRLPVLKYDPKINGPKVPFFMDDREIPVSQFVPRENPRALVIRPTEHWPLRTKSEKFSGIEDKLSSTHIYDNGENGSGNVDTYSEKPKMEHTDDSPEERNSAVKVHKVEELLPKLQLSGYYTEPRIQELAAKERAEPGFCSHVNNFVVGRHGYGSIKFMGETDVVSLDLDSIFEFNNREVIVYKDESMKPAVGKGLNKPAEITLLNIKCIDKKTGEQCMDGPRAEKYREMLRKKAEEQGAEYVSYDPVGGEWKFRVHHF